MSEKRAVCLNCMDGRAQMPVLKWIQDQHKVDYVDMITEPGMDGLLADHHFALDDITKKLNISIEKNNACMIFVVGHHDCKGNPASDDEHQDYVRLGAKRIQAEYSSLEVMGLWVNDDWEVEQVEV